jgi:hypothetical protein
MTAETARTLHIFREPVTGHLEAAALDTLIGQAGGTRHLDEIMKHILSIDPQDVRRLSGFVQKATRTPLTSKLYEAWLSAILSGPQTHAVNITSNALTTFLGPVERLLAAEADVVRAVALRSPRERFFGEAAMQVWGLTRGLREGVRAGLQAYRTELPVFGAARVTEATVRKGAIPGRLGRAVRVPLRALAAEDEFFKAVIKSMETHALTYREALQQGKTTREAVVRSLARSPSPGVIARAEREALYRTFNSP